MFGTEGVPGGERKDLSERIGRNVLAYAELMINGEQDLDQEEGMQTDGLNLMYC